MPKNDGEQRYNRIADTVAQWLGDTSRLLQCVQQALEHAEAADGAPPEAAALLSSLPPLIRECRTQVPTPEMIQVWVKWAVDRKHTDAQATPGPRATRQVARI